MPLVALQAASRQSRLAVAAERWDAILAARPELGPAVALQKHLIGLVLDLADLIDGTPLPRLSLPPRYLAAKLKGGTPALAGERIPMPVAVMTEPLLQLCGALAEGGAGEAADHIRELIARGEMDANSLLAASLSGDQNAIRTGAVHRGLSPDLLWLVGELAASPFVHALQRSLFGGDEETLRAALSAWNHGYCAACGSWPAL